LVRSARRRRTVSIAISNGAITLRSPLRTPRTYLVESLDRRREWILKRLEESVASPVAEVRAGSRLPVFGEAVLVEVLEWGGKRPRVRRQGESLVVELPAEADASSCNEAAERSVAAWYRKTAVATLPQMAEVMAARVGLTPRRILIRTQRSRWGSCSADGTIRLSWRLVMLEQALIEYVILHELAHLEHKNHQAGFWACVEKFEPRFRDMRRQLREAGRRLPRFAD
jgi:predicted metal-dependent hydrolase